MAQKPESIPEYISTLTVARCLERIADLATNIAEEVVFTVEGEVIRHGAGDDDDGGGEDNVVPLPRNRRV
jgi:phosphate uptake regulator